MKIISPFGKVRFLECYAGDTLTRPTLHPMDSSFALACTEGRVAPCWCLRAAVVPTDVAGVSTIRARQGLPVLPDRLPAFTSSAVCSTKLGGWPGCTASIGCPGSAG